MNWGSAENFWHMGGHGFFVWGTYAVALLLMVVEPWLVARRAQVALADAKAEAQRTSYEDNLP
jgi:heme exporter protein D